MKTWQSRIVISLLIGFIYSISVSAQTLDTSTCTACHQADGNSTQPQWPNIAGQHESYLLKQLRDFKQGSEGPRPNAIMQGLVADLSDDTLSALSQFYAEQRMSTGETPEAMLALGESIYKGGDLSYGVPACMACHGPTGAGNAWAGFPKVSGQWAEYTIAQLKQFQSGERHNDMNQMMRLAASRLTEEEIIAVSHYMAGLSEEKDN